MIKSAYNPENPPVLTTLPEDKVLLLRFNICT